MDERIANLSKRKTGGTGDVPEVITLPLEIRVHGRGGQGGVTCAKLIAGVYAQLGLNVQTFGDYGAERSGAPVRAFTRVDREVIKNRNKVYRPDHLLVLDSGLFGPTLLEGVSGGANLLINSSASHEELKKEYPGYRLGVVDATSIAREHGIGTSAVVIINTTVVGAYAALIGLPMEAVRRAYAFFNLEDDFEAALEASRNIAIFEPREQIAEQDGALTEPAAFSAVLPITEHLQDIPTELKTGAWATQSPCYQEYGAPCSIACPAGNDVVGFIQALKDEGVEKAAELLMKTQALPGVCGRVCPAPCMTACNRDFFDGPVNIRSLERWIADNENLEITREKDPHPRKFAVVGSGPAGLSSAFHLARRGQKVTLYEKSEKHGGVLRSGIPSYRLPEKALDKDISRIMQLGVETVCSTSIGREELERLSRENDAVIVCKGLGEPYAIGAAGEELEGVWQGLEFLARCRNEKQLIDLKGTVVVIGGGNTAIDCARTAVRSGASAVKLVYRRSREEMPAIQEEIEEASREGVQILTQRQPVAFIGDGNVRGIVVAEVEAGERDEDGRHRPLVTDRTMEISCETVLLALGQRKDFDLLPEGWSIEHGRAVDGEDLLNIWFAGDCLTGDGTVAHAIGNGRRVALAALAACGGENGVQEKKYKSTVAPAHIRFSHFPVIPPSKERQRQVSSWKNDFEEINLGLPGPGEAERCFSCGRCTLCDTCLVYCPEGIIFKEDAGYSIDQEYCKGCGICVAECPRRAMEMIEK